MLRRLSPVAAGSTFQVPVHIAGGSDISSVPLQFHYDASKLTLVNVTGGDFLSHDGQPMALIHRDDGPGNVTIVASRPPGSCRSERFGRLVRPNISGEGCGRDRPGDDPR